eukprot:TRINITY_DN360_c0_g1_i1.p1 TRINITY_DN360_c0_g1~~TRINITY_DN360_c0_g1_i1.p1  ORF type:complete len:270 (+),score=27.20 TRINITY_DN360_c0_g1_i1:170-979(+)
MSGRQVYQINSLTGENEILTSYPISFNPYNSVVSGGVYYTLSSTFEGTVTVWNVTGLDLSTNNLMGSFTVAQTPFETAFFDSALYPADGGTLIWALRTSIYNGTYVFKIDPTSETSTVVLKIKNEEERALCYNPQKQMIWFWSISSANRYVFRSVDIRSGQSSPQWSANYFMFNDMEYDRQSGMFYGVTTPNHYSGINALLTFDGSRFNQVVADVDLVPGAISQIDRTYTYPGVKSATNVLSTRKLNGAVVASVEVPQFFSSSNLAYAK